MGLKAFKGERPKKDEVIVAKNHLTEDEVINPNLMVSAYLDIAEAKAHENASMHMKDWVSELGDFIIYCKKSQLSGGGTISHDDAIDIATSEYEKYKSKTREDLTQVERDFLETIHKTYQLLEGKPKKNNCGLGI